jgi:serine/threonine protein kinase
MVSVVCLHALYCTDDIKLFDFGMAKELKPEHKVDDENYRLSFCGSPRYMAPGTFYTLFPRLTIFRTLRLKFTWSTSSMLDLYRGLGKDALQLVV